MTFPRLFAAAAIVLGTAFAVSSAGMKCDEKANSASKKASCCASAKATKVSATVDADGCSEKAVKVADAKECSAAEKAACSSTKVAKKVKSESGCCASKAKGVKVSSADAPTTPVVAAPETASNEK